MSLIASVTLKHFTVICSDGLVVKIVNGAPVPFCEQTCKYWTVGERRDIAIGSTGSALMSVLMSNFSTKLSEQHRDNPELFSILEKVVPDELQRLSKLFPTESNIEYIDGTESINLGGINLLMAGYDAAQQRIRCISWNDECKEMCCQGKDPGLKPHENGSGTILTLGYCKVSSFSEMFDQSCVLDGPLAVANEMKNAVQKVAEAFPKFIGGDIRSHIIMVPEIREIYEAELKENETNEIRIATAHQCDICKLKTKDFILNEWKHLVPKEPRIETCLNKMI
jgi:hypothetical protein